MRSIATTTEVEASIGAFVKALSMGLRIDAIILYGSYVSGAPRAWSDFDVAVISPDFEGVPMWRRQEMLAEQSGGTEPRISPIGYPASEYHNPRAGSFLREILATGRVVYEAPK